MNSHISEKSDNEIAPIENRILTIRNCQVLIDKDLAELYGVETKVLNQAVKRNIERFPPDFRFQLTKEEFRELVTNCDRFISLKHSSTCPFAFTEQGVSMLSCVLKSATAIDISIKIIRAFVAMRHYLQNNSLLMHRLEKIENQQIMMKIENDNKFSLIFNKLDSTALPPKQGVFFQGQIFDAYQFVADLIRSAETSIILIDNYVNDSVLTLLNKRVENVTATIGVNKISAGLQLDLQKHNAQYPPIAVREIADIHDRFLLIDSKKLYTFGASFKDLGKKLFCFSAIESEEVIQWIAEKITD